LDRGYKLVPNGDPTAFYVWQNGVVAFKVPAPPYPRRIVLTATRFIPAGEQLAWCYSENCVGDYTIEVGFSIAEFVQGYPSRWQVRNNDDGVIAVSSITWINAETLAFDFDVDVGEKVTVEKFEENSGSEK